MMCDSHELGITTDAGYAATEVWVNFKLHVTGLSKERLDYDSYVAAVNQELVKWQGSRDKVGKISFPDAEHLTAFVLAWS